ncbi:hypothetical protein BXQ17_08910 [Polaribacter sp. BM10]|uniref:hypothetical protein n=1 Tax=Polaribacter sp. BM10 TaxID=1529069 RepID=UPI000989BE95|nr:hypothetical protein [Polaribacter sp. BM10]AQS94173.1 hypothetical protein BXQ17_08910 [Polaribacter sp. BM10]
MKKLIIILLIFIGCKSKENFNKETYYKEVSEKEVQKHYKSYTITIPDNWFSYKTDPGLMAHSPNEFKSIIKPNKNQTRFIIRNSFQSSKKIQKNLNQFISNKKKHYTNFEYKLHERNHKTYGKFYVVQYASNENNERVINIVCILKAKNKIYNIYFSGTPKKYDKYLDDAIEMINSFKLAS